MPPSSTGCRGDIEVTTYDRRRRHAGHRRHIGRVGGSTGPIQAAYLDDLLHWPDPIPGGELRGVGLSAGRRMRDVMARQDTPVHAGTHPSMCTAGIAPGNSPVTTEPFTQWVIEDQSPRGARRGERVGARITRHVEHYEKMKIRLLNGGHQVLCYVGLLLGYRNAPEAMADPQVERLLRSGSWTRRSRRCSRPVPGVDLGHYRRTLRERFANPAINDQLGADRHRRVVAHPRVPPADEPGAPARRTARSGSRRSPSRPGSDTSRGLDERGRRCRSAIP